MAFCSHNESDLAPDIIMVTKEGKKSDWIVVRCTSCGEAIGGRRSLLDLVDQITREHLGLDD